MGVIPAYAEGEGVIKINNNVGVTGVSMKDHVYSIYKVFDLTLDQKEGTNKYAYTLTEKFKKFFEDKNGGNTDLNEFAKTYMQEHKTIVADELRKYIIENNIEATTVTGNTNYSNANGIETVTISGLDLGHYLILDNGINGNTKPTAIALASMGTTDKELVINLKADRPSIDKEIKHNETGEWGNVGDNQIGDTVEYRFISTVPDITGYTNYKYLIHDKMTKGLTFNKDTVEIYVGEKGTGKLLDKKYYEVITNPGHEHTFDIDIKIKDVINDKVAVKGDKLYIYFIATLNENAVTAGNSNDNTVDLEYSNNPYDENSNDKAPEVTVKDYTFKLNGLKVNESNTPLQGAEFEIRKGTEPLYFVKNGDDYTVCSKNHDHTSDPSCTKTIISGETGKFNIIGLDDQTTYTIVETKAPDGYNQIKPIDFKITATYDEKGNITGISTDATGITVVDGTFELGTTIINKTDSLLPETGGIGTTIFTVVGAGIMLIAGVMLVKRRRA
ncbi:MAG: SpaH/EbpB family LPXTG-anchored major pilin [Clostridium sp.]